MAIIGSLEIQLMANMARLQADMNQAKQAVGGAMSSIEKSVASAKNALSGLGAAIGLGVGLNEFIKLSDQYTKYTAQLKLATQSTEQFNAANADVQRIAKQTETGLAGIGLLYARITGATRELGTSQREVSKITETVGLSLKVAGASAAESGSAMLQLSQAFGAGALRGEEFNAVSEAAPGLIRILADSLGVAQGSLKELAKDGKLTTEVLTKAFTDERVLSGLRDQATQVRTIAGAFTLLKNELLLFTGRQNEASGAGAALASVIGTVARNIDLLSAAALGYGAVKLGSIIISSVDAGLALVKATMDGTAAANASRIATIAEAQAKAAATASTVALTTARVAELRSAVLAAEGAVALAIATNGLIPAQTRAAAAAAAHSAALTVLSTAQTAATGTAAFASRALGLLGGPVGAIVTVLGLGITAWSLWGSSARKQSEDATKAVTDQAPALLVSIDEQIRKLKERNSLANVPVNGLEGYNPYTAQTMGLEAKYQKLVTATGKTETEEIVRKQQLRTTLEELALRYAKQNELLAEQATAQKNANKEARKVEFTKYANDAEKLAVELERVKVALGGDIPADLEKRIRDKFTPKSSGAEKIDPQIKAYEQLIASIREKISLNNEEIALGRKLTESEKQVFDIQKLVAKGSISAGDASSQKTKALLFELSVSERLQEINTANLELEKTLRDEKAKFVDAMGAANAASLEQNKTLADEVALIGLSNEAQHALTQARLQDVIGIKEQNLARLQSAEFMSKEQIALEEEIRLLKEKAALQGQKFVRTAEFEKLTELNKQSKQFTDDLERGLTDSLYRAFESGKGFFKTLWDGIKNLFKTTALKLIVNAVVGGAGIGGGTMASAANSILGGGGATSSSIGIIDTVSKAYSAVTGGFAAMSNSVAFAAQDIGAWLQANTTGALNKAGTSLMQSSGALGTAAGYAAGAVAGVVLGRAISGEFSVFGSNKNTAVVAGTAIGAIFGGPLGAAIGGAINGLVNRAFGMGQKRTSATGITGTFSTTGASVQNFQDWNQKGGWFRSDKSGTNYSGMDGGANDAINKALIMTSGALRTYAAMIGLSADAVNGFSQAIRINLMGLSAADAEKAVLNAIGNFGEAMATSAYGAALQSFKLANETTTATLSRLATDLASVNTAFKNMGITLMAASLAGADASSKLIAMAGGLEKFTSQTNAYYTAFYSQAERTANVTSQLSEALGAIGMGMPSTRDGFRALVEAQNLMTDAGRTTYSMLLALAPAFAEISTAVEGSIAGLSEAMRKLQGDTASLQIELMRAGGNTTGADAAQRTIDTTGLNAAELAVFDYNASLRLQVTSLTSAAAAIKLMATSADGLRGAVSTARMVQLSPAQSLAQQQGAFAGNYSMALSTTGTTQAAYADKMTAALPGLSLALMDAARTREEWAMSTAALFAQSETIAQRLDTPNVLGGFGLPAFDASGTVQMPSAMQTQQNTAGNSSADVLQELRALRSEVQGLRAEAQATASHTNKTSRILERVTRDGEAMQTVVAA